MPTAPQFTVTRLDLAGARCPALFCSGLQPSDVPTAEMVAAAIGRAVRQFGIGGCAGQMAQPCADSAGRSRLAPCPRRSSWPPRDAR